MSNEKKEELYKKAFGKGDGCHHFPEMKELVILCMEMTEDQFKISLKEKLKEAINVLQELDIDEVSKQGGISALNLVLEECKLTYPIDYSK